MNSGVGTDWKVDGSFYTSERFFKLKAGEQIEFRSLLQYPNMPFSFELCLLTEAVPFEGRISQGPSGSERIAFYEDKIGASAAIQTPAQPPAVTNPPNPTAQQSVTVSKTEMSKAGNDVVLRYSLKNVGTSDRYILPVLELDPSTLPPNQTIGISFDVWLNGNKYPGPNENYLKLLPGETKEIKWLLGAPAAPVKVDFFYLPEAIAFNGDVSMSASGSSQITIYNEIIK